MKSRKHISIIAFYLLYSLSSSAQSIEGVKNIEEKYKRCLDQGTDKAVCTENYYKQIDSMLTVQYKMLRSKCDSTQKENLKDEQLGWLINRNNAFKLNKQKVKNAEFVKKKINDLSIATPKNYSIENYVVRSTGYYTLDAKTKTINGETYGTTGEIYIKDLSNHKIAISLFVCGGAPGNNFGTIADTLSEEDNKAIYQSTDDPTCKLIFHLSNKGIFLEQISKDNQWACGFGYGVYAQG